jgi:alkylation response protein AidB-like acyl-CoA dehydrogenase
MDSSAGEGKRPVAHAMEKYAVECSINKVFATEMVSYVVDEGVQIHGGYGFISEYPIERLYRDARIYRIFEGTNEINRALIPTMFLRRSALGGLPLFEAADKLLKQLEDPAGLPVLKDAAALVQSAKQVFLLTLGVGRQRCGDDLVKRQEILGRLADLAIGAFAMESAWLRAQKGMENGSESGAQLRMNMAEAFIYTHFPRIELRAREALLELADGAESGKLLNFLARLTRYEPINIIRLREKIADTILSN